MTRGVRAMGCPRARLPRANSTDEDVCKSVRTHQQVSTMRQGQAPTRPGRGVDANPIDAFCHVGQSWRTTDLSMFYILAVMPDYKHASGFTSGTRFHQSDAERMLLYGCRFAV